MAIEKVRLPVGRIVGGNPAVAQPKTNFQTNQPVLDKEGKPIQEWRCDIAIPKNEFLSKVWPLMLQEAATAFPINPQTGQPNVSRDFAWKMVDGDSPETPKRSKVPYNQREGYPGHYILKISTEAFAPPIFKFENGAYRKIEPNEIKRGDYVVPNVDIKVHTNNDGGLYLNPNGFELVGYGAAIASTASADPTEMFGGQPVQLPPGASPVPVGAPAGVPMPQMGQMPAAMPQMGNAPVMPVMPTAMPTAAQYQVGAGMTTTGQNAMTPAYPSNPSLPPPAHDFVQNAGNYAPAPMVGLPPTMPQMGVATAIGATSFPTSGIPGIPPTR